MEVYKQIKKDLLSLLVFLIILTAICNTFDIGIDATDKDGFNRSGFTLLKDYGTNKEYLYKNGVIIERK